MPVFDLNTLNHLPDYLLVVGICLCVSKLLFQDLKSNNIFLFNKGSHAETYNVVGCTVGNSEGMGESMFVFFFRESIEFLDGTLGESFVEIIGAEDHLGLIVAFAQEDRK